MPKKTIPSQADISIFHEAVKDVKPLKQDKTPLHQKKPAQKSQKHRILPEAAFDFTESPEIAAVTGEEFIAYKQSGIPNKTLRKLRKGQYNVDAMLDLHGRTVDEAKMAVDQFLQECRHQGVRVGLIIHGKGLHGTMPILKNKLNQWLRGANIVLAFCSATPTHGSRGAIYVLLKRTEEERACE